MKTRKKRLKKVFKNAHDCLEVFAAQSQECGAYKYTSGGGWLQAERKGIKHRAVFFEKDRAYSYGEHYLLAKIGLTLNGVKFSLVNYTHYSNITSRHSWEACCALKKAKHKVFIFDLSNAEVNSYTSDESLVKLVLRQMQESADSLIEQAFTYQFSKQVHYSSLVSDIKEHNKLVLSFGLKNLGVKIPKEILKTVKLNEKQICIEYMDKRKRQQRSLFDRNYSY